MSLNYRLPAKLPFRSVLRRQFHILGQFQPSYGFTIPASQHLTKQQLQDGGVIHLHVICELLRLALLNWTVKVTFLILEWGDKLPLQKGECPELSLLAFLASISCHSHALHVAHSSYPVHPA
jgi:hypothetical protein